MEYIEGEGLGDLVLADDVPLGSREAEKDPRCCLVGVSVELLRTVEKDAVDCLLDAGAESEPLDVGVGVESEGSAAAVVDTLGRRKLDDEGAVMEMLPPPVERLDRTVSKLVCGVGVLYR